MPSPGPGGVDCGSTSRNAASRPILPATASAGTIGASCLGIYVRARLCHFDHYVAQMVAECREHRIMRDIRFSHGNPATDRDERQSGSINL